MDVKSAFLYRKIEKEVYVFQPPGYEDPDFSAKVYKVEKALYELHQAPRAWYETLLTYSIDNGFHKGQINKTLLIKGHKDDILLVQVYVDDIILVNQERIKSMIRSWMYLTASKPDITFAVYACARFQVTPKTLHLHAMKRILRYLKGQPKLGLWYHRDSPFDLESIIGGCQFLGKRLISWHCKKQTILANSTSKAEYVAAASCCGHVLWIPNQMLGYGFNLIYTKINIDNKNDAEGTVCLSNNAIFKGLARMGKHKPRRKQRKVTEVPHTEPQVKERVPTPSYDPLPSGEDRLQLNELMDICTKLSDMVLSLEQTSTNQAAEIKKLKKRVKKLKEKKKKRAHGLKRRRIAEIDANEDLFLIDETAQYQGGIKDQDLFGVYDLDGDEVFVDVTTSKNVEQDATVAESVEGIVVATTLQISKDELTLDQTLMEIKAAKPKAKGDKDKGKGIMVESEKPLKMKDQIALDEEVARKPEAKMKAKMDEEERIAREKNEENKVVIKEWDKLDEQEQAKVADDDTAELKICLEIVPEDDDDVAIKATLLSSKSPTIVDYKIYIEGKKSYFKIIRADGNSQNYLTFRTMFKNFNREDLEVLRSIVKKRFKKTKPIDNMDNILFQTIKTMFEHHVEDIIWKYQQGAVKVNNW
uniref:Putative ribonuclease H-like domain-containing protein n=1 Tax=Tanacetum cinerariifolium TaxID=118510 RepID=A0A699HMF8_TANCI|nr:putative ribonuclease H-like domain-containing protein [Tanacetum cinerariifolium]